MHVLRSKHQKLILQCYPPGKAVDKKANPSELSYLLYYASTRRVKLEKVVDFLNAKTRADVRGRKSGNLSVTLQIVSSLIDKCFENLNSFAPQVCSILSAVETLKELPLARALIATFGVFCARLDNGLFTGDKGFVDAFRRLTNALLQGTEAQSNSHATSRRDWKLLSLRTCRHVFACLPHNANLGASFIPLAVSILAPTVGECHSLESLSARLRTALNVEQGAGDRLLTKTTTARSIPGPIPRASSDDDAIDESVLGDEALLALRALFNTTVSHQIITATRSVVDYDFERLHNDSKVPQGSSGGTRGTLGGIKGTLGGIKGTMGTNSESLDTRQQLSLSDTKGKDRLGLSGSSATSSRDPSVSCRDSGVSEWGTVFLQVCASFIPVQLRFETLLTLLDSLSQVSQHAESSSKSSGSSRGNLSEGAASHIDSKGRISGSKAKTRLSSDSQARKVSDKKHTQTVSGKIHSQAVSSKTPAQTVSGRGFPFPKSSVSPGTEFLHMRHYAAHIRSLVSSALNMIGLSISDILVQFLALKTSLYLRLAEVLSAREVADLSVMYSECICNLASHIYYFDQVSDSIEGILMHVDIVLLTAENPSARRSYFLVLDLLDMISRIMDLLAANASAITWNHATLENWEVSFQLLTFSKSYAKFTSFVPPKDVRHIQAKYLDIVSKFLDTELYTEAKRPDRDDSVDYMARFLEPNYKNYVQDKDNTLSALLLHCGEYFTEGFFDFKAAQSLSKILGVIASVTGVNFAHNFLVVFDAWQLQKPTSSVALVARDLCAYYVLTMTVATLNEKYEDLLTEDISDSSLSSALCHDVKARNEYLWNLGAGFQQPSPTDLFSQQLSIGTIESFFATTPFEKWLVPPNTILVDLQDGQGHKSVNDTEAGAFVEYDDASLGFTLPVQGGGLGLGSAVDISSIYSGLQGTRGNGVNGKTTDYLTPDTTQITQYTDASYKTQGVQLAQLHKRVAIPRVEDLKRSMEGASTFKVGLHDLHGNGGTPNSVLYDSLHRTSVRSILEDLKSDEDRDIVV